MKLQIEKILHEKKISKTIFAQMMGIKKQNVNLLLETRNIDKIQEIANILRVDINDLLFEKKEEKIVPTINGYVEVENEIYPIKSREQYVSLMDKIDGIVHIPSCTRGENLRENILSFYSKSIINNQSGAIMMRYGINEIFTLTYDAKSKRFTLTLCKDDGITEYTTYDVESYYYIGLIDTSAKHTLVDDITDYIEYVYK
jgi:DNA-binding Xre family transcriptional regulator